MPRLTEAQERARDVRDLKILVLLDLGFSQREVCARLGITRGLIAKLLRGIREGEA